MPAASVVVGFLLSSVGAKAIMAVTGFGLWAFVIVHLLGNLQIFQGPTAINEYGVWLRALGHGSFVWVMRAGLVACFALHIAFAVRLVRLNAAARGIQPYAKKQRLRTTPAALSMALSGFLILAFLIFHLA